MDTKEDLVTKKINLEVQLNPVTENRFSILIDLANAINAFRLFPRIFITTYIYLLYEVVVWFMALQDPNTQQAGLVSVVVGAGAGWFAAYTASGGASKNKK